MKVRKLPCYCMFLLMLTCSLFYENDLRAQRGGTSSGNIPITGTIKDQMNAPIPGVVIQNLNTKKVVLTDNKGNFAIDARKRD